MKFVKKYSPPLIKKSCLGVLTYIFILHIFILVYHTQNYHYGSSRLINFFNISSIGKENITRNLNSFINKELKNSGQVDLVKNKSFTQNIGSISILKKRFKKKCRKKREIYVSSNGRLGNQMFALASLYGIGRSYNLTPVISASSNKLLQMFDNFTISTYIRVKKKIPIHLEKISQHMAASYDDKLLKNTKCDKKLIGYFQSWKYFTKYDHHIRELFKFKKKIKSIVENILNNIKNSFLNLKDKDNITFIGIHIRRGDFIGPRSLAYGYLAAPLTYILKAMNLFKNKFKNIIFIACSDDTKWVKKHLSLPNIYISEGQPPEIDMSLLSLCNHSIITVGSYGWWGAWLANGQTIYYSNWPKRNSHLYKAYNMSDYYPPEWISLGD